VLVKGYSDLIKTILIRANQQGIRLHVYITETRPQCDGYLMYNELTKHKINCTLIVDSAIGFVLEEMDYVISGAEVVTENGGIINRLGTYTTALCAKALQKPFYVFAENFKFSRIFPLSHKDLPDEITKNSKFDFCPGSWNLRMPPEEVNLVCPICDFTPGQLISFIITDARIFKPSAVSDELLQLFNL
jgi:translation initiation factor eIF-2B subunit alpha